MDLQDLAERLDRLEGAHRALSAQHIALRQVCRAMLPLIDGNPALLRRVLLEAYDASNEDMEAQGHDEAFQALVRQNLDVFSASILAVADMRRQRDDDSSRTP